MTAILLWPSPIHAEPIKCDFEWGVSVAEMAKRLRLSEKATAKVDGVLVPRSEWIDTTRDLRPITLYNRPENLGTILATVAIVAIAAAAGPLGGFVAAGVGGGLLGSVAGGLASAAFSVAGNLLVRALFPPSSANISQEDPATTYSIGAVRNQTRLDQPIPLILGRVVAAPDLMATQVTYFEDRDEYLQAAFCHGYGPLAIRQLKLADTALTSFEGVERENVQNFSDTKHTLYSKDISPEFFTVALEEGINNERTTAPDTKRAFLDFRAPNGIYELTDRGKIREYPITIRVQYRLTGTTQWTEHDAAYLIPSLKRDAILQTLRIKFPTPGQYDIRLTRITADDGPDDKHTYQTDLTWASVKSEQDGAPFNLDYPVAATFTQIKATGQLNGPLDRVNAEVTSLGKKWNSSTDTWDSNQEINNPADLVRLCLQHPANPKAVADSSIDLPSLQRWSEYCDVKGWTFNQRRDSVSSWDDVIADICAAGRAVHIFANNQHTFVYDDEAAPIVHHFTPQNSSGFTVEHDYPDPPHALKVRFFDEDNNFTPQDRIVYAAGYDETNATLFERFEMPGVTNSDQAWKFGRYYLNELILRPETLSLQCDWESLDFGYGARVAVTHDVIAVGKTTGRVKSTSGSTVTLDTPVAMSESQSYGLVYKIDTGAVVTRAVTYEAGQATTITLSDAGTAPADETTFGFGPLTSLKEEYRVRRVTRDGDFGAQVELVNHNTAITSDDAATPDAWSPATTSQIEPAPLTYSPAAGQAVEFVRMVNNESETVVRLSWSPPEYGPVDYYQILVTGADGSFEAGRATDTSFDISGLVPGSYTFSVVASFKDVSGLSGPLTVAFTVSGDEVRHIAPDAPTGLSASGGVARAVVSWTIPDIPDLLHIEVMAGSSTDFAAAAVLGRTLGDQLSEEGLGVSDTRYYWARSVTLADTNNTSAWTGPVSATTSGVTSALLEDDSVLISKLASSALAHIDDADIANANAIIAEASTRAAADGTNAAAIATETTTRESADTALASDITTLFTETGNNAAAISTETAARISGDQAEATARQALASTVGDNSAAISAETTARTSADSALASDITTLFTESGDNAAAIVAETSARTSADSSLASDITSLTATVGSNTASISNETAARIAADGTITAEQTVTFDVNGRVTGYGLIAGAKFSEFGVRTDRFTVARPDGTGSKFVFVIGQVDGVSQVAINGDLVVDGSIIGRHVATETLNSDHIQAGSLAADRIQVGGGGNLLNNVDFTDGLEGWVLTRNSGTGAETDLLFIAPGAAYGGPEYPTIAMYQDGSQVDGYSDIRFVPDFLANVSAAFGIAVNAGEWIDLSCKIATLRCEARIYAIYFDAAGAFISQAQNFGLEYPGSSTNPGTWTRIWLKSQVPANAASVVFTIRKSPTNSGTTSWCFVHQPQLAYTHANATGPGSFTNGGVSIIGGGRIKTDAITVDKIAANAVTANELAANSVTATEANFTTLTALSLEVQTAEIANLAVANGKITDNAVSEYDVSGSTTASGVIGNYASNTWGNYISVSITVAHAGRLLIHGFLRFDNDSGATSAIRSRVSVDNVGPSHSRRDFDLPAGNKNYHDFWVTRLITPGTYIVRLQAQTQTDVEVLSGNLFIGQYKK